MLAARADDLARQEAIKRIEHKRRYWIGTAVSTDDMLLLAAIWAIIEYHNAGGWPTQESARVQGSMTCGISGSSTRPWRGSS